MKKKLKLIEEHVSLSNYWYFKNISSKDQIQKNFINLSKIKKFIKIFLEKYFNIKLIRTDSLALNYSTFEKSSRLTQKSVIEIRDKLLAQKFSKFFNKLKIKTKQKNLKKIIKKHDEFFFRENNIKDNYGGISYNSSLSLFLFSSIVKPNTIIESGVWKGFTTTIFDKTNVKVPKFCFDINFSKLLYKSKNAKYINKDIQDYNFESIKFFRKCLAFFDDHVSQYERFLFCKKRKIPFIVFDDDYDYFSIHIDGWPSIPTISMIRNINKINSDLTWKSLNRSGYYKYKRINPNILNGYYYCKAPDLYSLTGYQNNSMMSFLVKKIN
jgi:hypothetical protein